MDARLPGPYNGRDQGVAMSDIEIERDVDRRPLAAPARRYAPLPASAEDRKSVV